MARVHWSTPALNDLRTLIEWLDEHHGPQIAARTAEAIADTVRRVVARPDGFAWVGSVYPELAVLPAAWRRALTHTRRHAVYYRYRAELDQVDILAVRSAGQLPPAAARLQQART